MGSGILKSSKSRLTEKQIELFPTDSLFDKIARSVCLAGVLPAKELFEAWEVARRVRRKYRGGRIVDFASGHGLLSHILLLLDDSSREAVAVDSNFPPNAFKLSRSIISKWPKLNGRIKYVETSIQEFELSSRDLVLSIHACGTLTDTVLEKAVSARAKVAVLPCCQDIGLSETGGLEGWIDGTLAVDIIRATRLSLLGYKVITRKIPEEITPKNRLLMAHPESP